MTKDSGRKALYRNSGLSDRLTLARILPTSVIPAPCLPAGRKAGIQTPSRRKSGAITKVAGFRIGSGMTTMNIFKSVTNCVVFLITFFVFSSLRLPIVNAGGENEGVLSFSNKDLEAYREPVAERIPEIKSEKVEDKEAIQETKRTEKEREYWCHKAYQYNQKIEKAQDEVKKTESELSDLKDTGSQSSFKKKRALEKKIKNAQKRLDGARKRLGYAEKDLSFVEDEARRKDIPPGWLRCQFE